MALQEEFEQQGNWLFRYRSFLPIFILIIAFIVHIYKELDPESYTLEDTRYEIYYERFCLLISLFGLAIRIYAVGHTPARTSGRNTKEQLAEQLNTTGIYSLVRHPLYLGIFFIWLGLAMMTGSPWFVLIFILAFWIYYERIMYAEEQFLRKKFGIVYEEWAAKTPAFIPSFYFRKFTRPSLPFSWKKVLKKEKNGLVAIFLIFALFNISGEMMENKPDFDNTILALAGLTIMMYILLKYLKTYTGVLIEKGR